MAFGYGYPAYQPPMYQVPNPAPYQQQIGSVPAQYQQQGPQPAPQPQMQQAGQQPGMICRPVASEEEARAVPTDFSGATIVMTDAAHGRIYTKSLNYMDGSALFHTYQLVQPQAVPTAETAAPVVEYAHREELEILRAELESLRAELEENKKVVGGPGKRAAAKGAATE